MTFMWHVTCHERNTPTHNRTGQSYLVDNQPRPGMSVVHSLWRHSILAGDSMSQMTDNRLTTVKHIV